MQSPFAVLIAPAGAGSYGDEAIIAGSLHALRRRRFRNVKIVWPAAPPARVSLPEMHVESMVLPDPRSIPVAGVIGAYREIIGGASRVYLLGTDILDGFYSPFKALFALALAETAARVCAQVTIAGFSLNSHVHPDCAGALQRLPESVRLCVRDPVSGRRARELGLRNIRKAADIAFLLEPAREDAAPELSEWVAAERAEGRRILGFNVSALGLRSLGLNRDEAVSIYARAVSRLTRGGGGCSIVFLGHDRRGGNNDFALLHAVNEELAKGARRRVTSGEALCSAAAVKRFCGCLDLVVSHRMHLAIAAAGMRVPALALEYQGKVQGLWELLGTPESMTSAEDWGSAAALVRRIARSLESAGAVQSKLDYKIAGVRRLAGANFGPFTSVVPVR